MPDLTDLFRQVDEAENDIVALEQALVRIPSVNTGFMPTGDETPVCELAETSWPQTASSPKYWSRRPTGGT